MVDLDGACRVGNVSSVCIQVSTADHVVVAIMLFSEQSWPWSKKRLENNPAYDPQMSEVGHGVLFLLPIKVIEKVRRVGVSRTVVRTRYSPVHASAAILCSVSVS